MLASENKKNGVIIAIDGPVASGKGTVAPRLAEVLHGFYLSTGAMYRCVALYALRHDLFTNTAALVASLPHLRIRMAEGRVFLNDEDVTEAIHENTISQKTPHVAGIPEVRKALVGIQQSIGEEYAKQGTVVIAEGRDIGTVVFPEAQVKLYLTASPAVRARRRLEQLHAQGDKHATYTEVFQDTIARDRYDEEETKALVTNPEEKGYKVIDSTDLQEKETIASILRFLQQEGVVHD